MIELHATKYFTPKEVAPRLMVSYWTVLRMIERQEIKVVGTNKRRYRIPQEEIERLLSPVLVHANSR